MNSFFKFGLKISSTIAILGLLSACNSNPPPPPIATPSPTKPPAQVKVGLALGGGAAKGFAHIGVIKMLEANGIKVEVVSGTSAGSVVGAMYASGMDAFALQERAFSLDESQIRDVNLLGGGLVKGQKLQDYVNQLVGNKSIQQFPKPFSAVATELETGNRVAFNRGNAGQAVRASSSIPGVFMPVLIGNKKFVDGGVVSPVPVDSARELGANFVIAVDISSKATGTAATSALGIMNQAVVIMGQKLGEQELARADIVIRPKIGKIGAADFDMKNVAILEGEKAALAMLPLIRQKMAEKALAGK
ncbi:patatin-like phospholipase family protein [Deefgea tanakiae]|uniref:Patatin-like phospholipase family protein n=1 Tax=Deefgea tanakiae TaxID=2865840 RepID=A0ABX8ZBF2_9NEIS|nr:patatin-like phospholipase family protein [Deefgea tanakiae]QZA79115.1 patatin-like phospholipase family protein [Deefgea tanakiae]